MEHTSKKRLPAVARNHDVAPRLLKHAGLAEPAPEVAGGYECKVLWMAMESPNTGLTGGGDFTSKECRMQSSRAPS